MWILGLLLLVASGALTVGLLTSTTANVTLKVFGQTYDKVPIGTVFVIGLCAGVAAIAGLVLFFSGWRRAGRKRKARRQELGAKRTRESELQEENARLARELSQQRRAGAVTPPPAMPSGQTATGSPATHGRDSGPRSAPPPAMPPPATSPPASSAGPSNHDRTTVMGSPTSSSPTSSSAPSEAPESRP